MGVRWVGGAASHRFRGCPDFPFPAIPPGADGVMMQSALAPCHAFAEDRARTAEARGREDRIALGRAASESERACS